MEIKVYPDEPLVDDKISITISGLSPQQKVTVKSSVTEGKYTFSCSACFISDSSGHVFVDKQPSILGTYTGPGPFPGVIDMFGMTGGLIEFRAAILASRGFIVFALPYFQYDDLPKYVKDINFDYLKESIDWFSNHSDVIKNGVGILGVSKGAEIALMLSLECPQVKSVVNINGTPFCSHYPLGPFTDFVESDFSRFEFTDEGVHLWDALNSNFKPDNVLNTWESDVQILYIIGDDDKSADPDYANVVYKCYPDNQKHKLTIKKYPKAGHLIEPAYLPVCRSSFDKVSGMVFVWGGIKEDHARAQEDSWKSILNFFKSTLLTNKTGSSFSSQL
ncbi:acyl-coenzyme A amino acid N-acyltransferase 2-like isoform X7 [Mytilus californianus]|uniref:acyl-coenzyme A amino acid N-acyltransferase 2-like isoform X7 n=1 Tax=Mytilus californianus TaxID=6549 RepID=UPI002247EE49|nr:acyl-coenzyme A amino acid N-acyltransferase 2-like isoform X7 [Mytilus californianus]